MKGTNEFKKVIKAYLDQRTQTDELFAAKYENPEKNVTDCVTYILNTVRKSGRSAYADDEVYSLAVHYYDEAEIEIGKPVTESMVEIVTPGSEIAAPAPAAPVVQNHLF